jgi:cephalosporin hydroxylase
MDPDAARRAVGAWERMWARLPAWRGVPCQQFTTDLWRYAELMHELRPPWVLECGTANGGPALFLADVAEALCCGMVISIDADSRPLPVAHPRLKLLKGDAADPGMPARVEAVTGPARGLVTLDDDHSSAHVLAELELWGPRAAYLICQDTIMEYLPQYDDGPHLALAKWLPDHPEFAPDPDPDPTNHPGGWLRRVAG